MVPWYMKAQYFGNHQNFKKLYWILENRVLLKYVMM